jgi:class 3 adenylate cyclase/predicted ATPase
VPRAEVVPSVPDPVSPGDLSPGPARIGTSWTLSPAGAMMCSNPSGRVMDIVVWLRSLGLGSYEAAFRDNDIDGTVLPSLTEEHLKQLGVTSLGHRVKLLDAITALHGDASSKAPSRDATTASSTQSPHPEDRAERRQVTVMFSDLVGSTALSARMDPEDLREVISAYQKCVAETVQRFGGFVAKYMGDGVLIYFGYPQAHEDDAERAVRSGLELVGAVGQLKTHAPLQTRVGIATGLVVVGDLIGSGASQEQAIVGETPNLAARLQAVAEPNRVAIAQSTRKLVGNLYELEDLGAQALKGMVGPVRAWAVLRPSQVESRFEAFHGSGLTELVGREEELEILLRRWSRSKTSQGQVVLVSGEAGIGKSRLTAALLEAIASELHTRLRLFCSPQHTDSALYPTIGQIERAAGFTRDDALQAKLDKLDALLAQSSTSAQDAALFAEMLSLSNDGRYPALDLTPQQRRQRTLDALASQAAALARQKPLLMIFEDAHWADPTSLELFSRIVDKIPSLPVLLIVTFRPEFDPPWIGRTNVTALTLNRLAVHEISAMIGRVVGNKQLPPSIRQDIIERTDGIPLFVEEMTKAVLEAEDEGAAEQTAATVPSPASAVPASLHASLMARLDRLGPAKEVAQTGAAIGRQFSHELLAVVVNKPEADLQSALDRLVASGLFFRQGMPPHAAYLFKHALVQDAAYSTLLREARRALHARITQTLENQFTEIAENQPELLARHCTEAGLIEKAVGLWDKAGQQSMTRSALVEADTQFARALDQISTLPATPARRREQIKLQVGRITPLMHIKGYAAPETQAAAERARLLIEQAEALGEPPEDPLVLFSVLYGFWAANLVAFNGEALRDLSAQFLRLAERTGATVPLMVGHEVTGISLTFTGDIAEGRAYLDRAIALYDPAEHRPLTTRFGQDHKVEALCFRSWALWFLGYPQAALTDAEDAIRNAREIGQAGSLMQALVITAFPLINCGNYVAADAQLQEVVALANEKGAALWQADGMMDQGCVSALTGKASNAIQMITTGLTAWRSTGATIRLPERLSCLAGAYADLGQYDDAGRYIAEAVTAMEKANERWFEAEVHRLAGEIALKSPQPDTEKGQSHFESALSVARQQQAKSWELRAAMSLARLWRDQGKVSQARELLAPLYGWFTEGFDTRDLKEAKALLEELSA